MLAAAKHDRFDRRYSSTRPPTYERPGKVRLAMTWSIALLQVPAEPLSLGNEAQGTVEVVGAVAGMSLVAQDLHLVTPQHPSVVEQPLRHHASDAGSAT